MNLRYTLIAILAIAFTSCSSPSVEDESALFEKEVSAENITVELSAQEQKLFDLVNEHRTAMGMDKLTFSNEAYKYAEEHNNYMIAQGELSHENFSARATKISNEVKANYVAENVAKDYPLVEMALEGWLDSAAHRKTIEGDFTHATLSIREDSKGKAYYTQIFFRK